ncbi:hypothetical protein IAG43_31995 [Streptomyces genisteinicus]|uniref:Tat pathway signal sequence domain protein n=2 Tax=Streptomyces genisteinicus TaxID=2768068 RepID=A0A7H0I4L2_9ACTN|nr:hypothetical protein IAG43_31995 [Streptomyces genisteinicus]
MRTWLPTRLLGLTAATLLVLTACSGTDASGDTAGSPTTRAPATPTGTAAPSPAPTADDGAPASPSASPAPSGRDAPLPGFPGLQPLWPFATLAEAGTWERAFRDGGGRPWHRDPVQTALSFTQGYLGFAGIDRVTSRDIGARQARIGVGASASEGTGTAAVIHLVRYGTGADAPWEVVGTDDADFSLTTPSYGSSAGSPLRAGGRITGVDESVRVDVRQPSSEQALGSTCCLSAGGKNRPWTSSVTFTGATDPVLTVVASTGGHVAEVERFTVTAVRTG